MKKYIEIFIGVLFLLFAYILDEQFSTRILIPVTILVPPAIFFMKRKINNWVKPVFVLFSIFLLAGFIFVDPCLGHRQQQILLFFTGVSLQLLMFYASTHVFEVHQAAGIDELTGCYNRKMFFELSEKIFENAKRNHKPVSIIFMDIDDFKEINDRNGHLFGDQILVKLSKVIKYAIREEDVLGRFGGDEFLVMVYGKENEQVLAIANRIKQEIESTFGIEDQIQISCSIGVATMIELPENISDIISVADQMLYEAKKRGKNTIASYNDIH